MWSSGRRLAAVLAAILIGLLAAGCDMVAELDVRSENHVEVELVINESGRCEGLTDFWGLQIEREGSLLCRATGTLDLTAAAQDRFLTVSRLGEYYLLDLRLPEESATVPIDLTIHFPGMVVDAGGGLISGNSVHFPKEYGVGAVGEIRVVALNHVGPPLWIIGTAAGLLLGALIAVGVMLGSGRQRPARAPAAAEAQLQALPQPEAGDRVEPVPAEAFTVASPPPQPSQPPPRAQPPVDHSIWAPPGHAGPEAPDPTPEPHDRTDR